MAIINVEVTDSDIIFYVTKGDQVVFTRTAGTAAKVRATRMVNNVVTAVFDGSYSGTNNAVTWQTWTIDDGDRDLVLDIDNGTATDDEAGPSKMLNGKIRVKP